MTVFYEEYTNDFCRRFRTESFRSGDLRAVKDWILGLCISGNYARDLSLIDPDGTNPWNLEPSRIEVNCYRDRNFSYWIHKIEDNGKIIYSDGKHTAGIKHWNEETKQLCRDLYQTKKNYQFNFG